MTEDIQIWLSFLQDFNGTMLFPQTDWNSNEVLQLFTDSSGSANMGSGAYFSGHWVFFQWPQSWCFSGILNDITFLELVPIVLSVLLWGHNFQNKKIVFQTDNIALVAVLNNQTSKSCRVMPFVRPLVLSAMKNNLIFRANHVSGKCNDIADSISRKQWVRFRRLAPEADRDPETIPEEFLHLICRVK